MSKQHKRVWVVLNYIENLLISASAVTGCVSISVFTSLVVIPILITSSTVVKNARNKNYKSIILKKKNSTTK